MSRYATLQQVTAEFSYPITFESLPVMIDQAGNAPAYAVVIQQVGSFQAIHTSVLSSQGELVFGDWIRFQCLVNKWRAERGATSSITEGVLSPAYQSIIGMGEKAIPLIISQLRIEGDDPDQWFWALQAITMKNPVNADDQGDFVKMAQSWIKWAEDEGYAG